VRLLVLCFMPEFASNDSQLQAAPYTYSYATLGEIFYRVDHSAGDLILEFLFGGLATVSVAGFGFMS
jgi:hypothetical protein